MRKLILAGVSAYAMRWFRKWLSGRNTRGAQTAEPLRRRTRPDRRAGPSAGYAGVERRVKQM